MKILIIFSIVLLINSIFSLNPGCKVTISQGSVNYMMQKLIPELEPEILKLELPDVSGSIGTIIGNIDYTISAIKLKSFNVGSANTVFSSPNIISGSLNSATVSLTANWIYKQESFPFLSDSGSCDATVGTNGQFQITVVVDETKDLVFKVTSFSPSIYDFNLELHGGASWLYSIFLGVFKGTILDIVQQKLGAQIPSIIETILKQEISSSYNPHSSIGNPNYNFFADFEFSSVDIVNSWLAMGVDGTIIRKGQDLPVFPGNRRPIPDFSPEFSNEMVQIYMSDYEFNAMGFELASIGMLNTILTQNESPDNVKYFFNTSNYASIIPDFSKKYPNKQIKLDIKPNTPIFFNITSQDMNSNYIMDVKFIVLDNGNEINAFTISLELNAHVVIIVPDRQNLMNAQFQLKNFNLKIKDTTIGNFDASLLNKLFFEISNNVFIPIANSFASTGIALPRVKGMYCTDPKILLKDGYILVGSSMDYVPSS